MLNLTLYQFLLSSFSNLLQRWKSTQSKYRIITKLRINRRFKSTDDVTRTQIRHRPVIASTQQQNQNRQTWMKSSYRSPAAKLLGYEGRVGRMTGWADDGVGGEWAAIDMAAALAGAKGCRGSAPGEWAPGVSSSIDAVLTVHWWMGWRWRWTLFIFDVEF